MAICKAPSGIPAENKLLRTAIRHALSQIVYENDLEIFYQRINQFVVDHASQVELIDYLKKNWVFKDIMKVKAERCVQIERTLYHFNTDLGRMSNYATDADISIMLKSYENALAAIQQLKDTYVNNLRTSDTQR